MAPRPRAPASPFGDASVALPCVRRESDSAGRRAAPDRGGGGGIRTHGGREPSSVFKTDPFDRSGTPPRPLLYLRPRLLRDARRRAVALQHLRHLAAEVLEDRER